MHRTCTRHLDATDFMPDIRTSWRQPLVETTWHQGRLDVQEAKSSFFTFFIFSVTQFFTVWY